jgi:ABC-type multidrug transport system ATPase subunit
MPEGHVLEFTRVTKRFNDVTAVSDFSARVEPGVVTAFLGPHGAGKTTTLRILLGQVRPTSGTATIGGVAYADLRTPLKTIGSVLEETVYRPRRSAARQLTIAAKANGIPLSRVDEVLALVGLDGEREGRIGSFSLGMRQRLSVAHALLGDAGTLVFDEPANGLDPEGIRWMRLLMRRLADEGRTVLVSSHVLSEVEQVADHVLVLSKGQLVLSSGIESLADPASGSVVVDAADRVALTAALAEAGFEVEVLRSGLTVRGGDAKTVGALAASAGIALSTLVQRGPTLEDVFIDLVRGGKFEPRPAIAASDDLEADAPVEGETSRSEADAGAVVGADEGADAGADGVAVDGDVEASLPDAETDDVAVAVAEGEGVEAATDVDEAETAASPEVIEEETSEGPEAPDAESATPDEDRIEGDDETTQSDAANDDADAVGGGQSEPGPSFDEILFGSGSAATESSAADDPAESEQEHAGTEVFAGLGDEPSDDDALAGDDSASESAADEQGEIADASAPESDADEDPRSAAVSSMLAAAARAYYEDEPQPYPFGEKAEGEGPADGEHHEGEQHEGEQHHDGEQHHEGEQHDGEHHEGEQHDGDHHEGEQHHEDEHHHEGEHHDGEHHRY